MIKDSGERAEYDSGMVRDTDKGKIRFDLCYPLGIPFKEQMLVRYATHMTDGAIKYTPRNWEKATGEEELSRFKQSAMRHFMQWFFGENDEDHAAATFFNITAYETTLYKINNNDNERSNSI